MAKIAINSVQSKPTSELIRRVALKTGKPIVEVEQIIREFIEEAIRGLLDGYVVKIDRLATFYPYPLDEKQTTIKAEVSVILRRDARFTKIRWKAFEEGEEKPQLKRIDL